MIGPQRLLGLYPRSWRARYGEEMADLLADRPASWADTLDLARGALDAHLHPPSPSRLPGLAAVTAGAAWAVVAIAALLEPVAPDWPGLLEWALPVALIGAVAGLIAMLGLVLGIGPGRHPVLRAATGLGILAVAVLLGVLALAVLGGPYGAVTGAALAIGGLGCIAVGAVAISRGASIAGDLLVIAGAGWLLPAPVAWLAAATAWTVLGLWMVGDRARQRPLGGPRPA